jgi:Bacterial TSP3 repeat
VDARIVDQVRTGKTQFGKNGIIAAPEDVGRWPEYKSDPAPLDNDHDGMPDEWEKKHGLNPNDPSDAAQDRDGDGYTNLEEYLNGTDPTKALDYTKRENNVNTLEMPKHK